MGAPKLFCEVDAAEVGQTVSIETHGRLIALLVGEETVWLEPDDAVRLAVSLSAAAWHVMFGGDG